MDITFTLTDPRLVKFERAEQAWLFIQDTKKVIAEHNWRYFEIGARLKVIRDQKLYTQVDGGYSTFDEFILDVGIGFKRRTAYNYIELYEYYVQDLELTQETVSSTPYYRLLEIKPMLKDKTKDEVTEIIKTQAMLPTHEYRQFKKENKIDNKAPRVFQTPQGKWTVEFYGSSTHRITNLEDATDVYHEPVTIPETNKES